MNILEGKLIGKQRAKVWNWSAKRRSLCVRCGRQLPGEQALASHYNTVHGLATRTVRSPYTGQSYTIPYIPEQKEQTTEVAA